MAMPLSGWLLTGASTMPHLQPLKPVLSPGQYARRREGYARFFYTMNKKVGLFLSVEKYQEYYVPIGFMRMT